MQAEVSTGVWVQVVSMEYIWKSGSDSCPQPGMQLASDLREFSVLVGIGRYKQES